MKYNILYNYYLCKSYKIITNIKHLRHAIIYTLISSEQTKFFSVGLYNFLATVHSRKKITLIHSLGFCESNKVGANFQFARLPQLIQHTIGW